ncbi:unnamed protein product [Bursaphelenchus xylophilus]|uniref:(pine wood nematode) hypothetical protein n=1 Tax=Bursaphelenchus xylophilus TaxID=6326 RepID=A0A7I8XH49_BURXY|nr:unnamed protein product [Bursaphelenchus xylophilus]CAG9079567.1 unnamed protein product [Bursaphelenchus xylophilus]
MGPFILFTLSPLGAALPTDESSIADEFPGAITMCLLRGLYTDDLAMENLAAPIINTNFRSSLLTSAMQSIESSRNARPSIQSPKRLPLTSTRRKR